MIGQSRPGDGFTDQVAEMVYTHAVENIDWSQPVPDSFERLHDALFAFYEKCARKPDYFADVEHAAAWVFATFRNLGAWPIDAPIAIGALEDLPEQSHPQVENRNASNIPDTGPAEHILRYFATPASPRSGRLSLSEREVNIVRGVAQYGLGDPNGRVPSWVYRALAGEIGGSAESIKRTYYAAKKAFAVVFYVVGSLGPANALISEEAIGGAVSTFRAHFRGQATWSILVFASTCALPELDGARVDPLRYTQAIETTATQATRLGWRLGGGAPPELLHPVESDVATFFERLDPKCVLTPCAAHATRQGEVRTS